MTRHTHLDALLVARHRVLDGELEAHEGVDRLAVVARQLLVLDGERRAIVPVEEEGAWRHEAQS